MVINIFCDASINESCHTACAGSFVTYQNDDNSVMDMYNTLIIQKNATNNSAEILAIWVGINEALKLREKYPNAIFRLFSDSKISLYGLRDWMKNWIYKIRSDGTLISSSGKPVSNQQRFIDIFNLIVQTNLRIELYHQRGHVGESGGVNLDKARVQFIRANKVAPERLGLSIEYLSRCNNEIDNFTRSALRRYIDGFIDNNVFVELANPFIVPIMKERLPQYIDLINKSSVLSYHDFKGGYSQ